MTPLPVPDVIDLFPGERGALLTLLESLTPAEWEAPTVCEGWSVKDIAAHLVGDDVGRLARGRDGHANPAFRIDPALDPWDGLVGAIDQQNEIWVTAMRRLSPPLLIDLLRLTGEKTDAYFRQLDLERIGGPVDWAGPEPVPVAFDLAREYTERWVHQQHIRDASNRPGLRERRWCHPVLATFVHGLRRSLSGAGAADGTAVRLTITGEAGGEWIAVKTGDHWQIGSDHEGPFAATVKLDQDTAWRLFTRGISPEEARARATLSGDPAMSGRILETVSILA